jgi:hypothetical protein
MQIQVTQTLTHSDESSGTTIFSDGTRAYWTEGDSPVVYSPTPVDSRPYSALLSSGEMGDMREMTEREEHEWEAARE